MKKFIEILVAVKSFAAMAFTGVIMLYVVAGYFFGISSISFSLIWQAVFIALLCGLLHFIAFTDYVFKKTGYLHRLLLFAAPMYLALGVFALAFKWFTPTLVAWVIFSIVFLAVFGLLTAVIQIYFKITGNKYNHMLDVYKSRLGD